MTALATCNGGQGIVWTDGRCLPAGIVGVAAPWIVNILIPIASSIMLVFMIRRCVGERRLTWHFLLAVASASTFWLETYGDWAQHLLYTPDFDHYTLPFRASAPHNPLAMPFLYALYWVTHAWAILRLAQWLQRRRPGTGLGVALLLLSVPVTFAWNLTIEGAATYAGWWTYDPPIGPAIDWRPLGGRGHWPLTWPLFLMFGWINLIAWMIGPPEESDRPNRLEQLFGFDERLVGPGGNAKVQALRLLGWIVFFNVTFALTLNLPLLAMRTLGGFDSVYLP